jgi:ubiquinone/menaquinone biosynthesis C-methylase UbiE
MSDEKQRPDWSQEHWREMLVEQRKFMWHDGTVEKLAVWLGLRPGMIAVDVGCGLGYLGYTYWPYFGRGGSYTGVDISDDLVRDASTAAQEWSADGKAHFLKGDAYALPIEDNFADVVMCQTLLIHLERPKEALAEMKRVVKPGGLIVCQEPDNLSASLAQPDGSVPKPDLDDQLLFMKCNILSNRGRIKLGRGDLNVGSKVPRLMKETGLVDIDVRMNDRVHLLLPPYEDSSQQQLLKQVKVRWFDDERREYWRTREKEEFLAGGGEADDWERILAYADKLKPIYRQQLNDGEFHLCSGAYFYVAKAKKPEVAG